MNGNTVLNQKKTLLSGRLSRCVASARIELCVMSPADPSDEYNLIIRSDGGMRDTTDYDSLVSSFREYVLSSLIPLTGDQSFISKNAETTLSFRC